MTTVPHGCVGEDGTALGCVGEDGDSACLRYNRNSYSVVVLARRNNTEILTDTLSFNTEIPLVSIQKFCLSVHISFIFNTEILSLMHIFLIAIQNFCLSTSQIF